MRISGVIITDDDKNVVSAIESIDSSCFEIIVVNTVESCDIKDLIKNDKVQIYPFKWCNDFSKARNFGIAKATGDWILTIDSDEVLEYPIKRLDTKFIAYLTKQQNKDFAYYTARVFQNNKGIKYRYKIHETIDHVLTETNCCKSDIVFLHKGYDISEKDMERKLKRNYDAMFYDYGNPIRHLHLGNWYFLNDKDYKKALSYYNRALKDRLNDEHKAVIYNNIHACGFKLKYSLVSLLEFLNKSIVFEPMQLYARVNIVEHLLSVPSVKDYEDVILKQLDKIEHIKENNLSCLIHSDLQLPDDYVESKRNELKSWRKAC